MKFKRITILILLIYILVLVGCGGTDSPEKVWKNYIKAMNAKNIESVAEVYYPKDSKNYISFVEGIDKESYFSFVSISTKSFTPVLVNPKYYCAEIEIDFENSSGVNTRKFFVYFYRDLDEKWRFISEVNPTTSDLELLGNKPDNGYYNSIVKTGDGFDYKYYYGTTTGIPNLNTDYVKIVAPNSNGKKIVIPSTIEGAPVTMIGDFAFFNYFRVFSVTFPTSKLEEIVIPDTVTTIEKYAFYQAKKLKELELPKSVNSVGQYAFASSGLTSLTINTNEDPMYGNIVEIVSKDSLTIIGNAVVYLGDLPTYEVSGHSVDWSISDENIATINSSGALNLLNSGEVIITATSKADPTMYSTAKVTVLPATEKNVEATSELDDLKFKTLKTNYVGDVLNITKGSIAANWSTSDENIAVFDNFGRLKLLAPGEVTIIATNKENESQVATATINVQDASKKYVETTLSHENDVIVFTGARNLYVSDYIKLKTTGYELGDIIWSSSDESIATVSTYEGVVTAHAEGSVIIKATLKDNPNISSVVEIKVSAVNPSITFSENALDRLYNLKTLYINAINPNSVVFKGNLKLPNDTIIYVPAQNYETYKTVWKDYEKQIQVMP